MSFYGSIYANTAAIYDNTEAIKVNKKSIDNNADAIQVNKDNITSNANAIETNAKAIETNANAIETNANAIETNKNNITDEIEDRKNSDKGLSDRIDTAVANINENTSAIGKEIEDRENAIDEVKDIIGAVSEEETVVGLIDEVKDIIGAVPKDKTVVNLIDETKSDAEDKINALADGQVKANADAIININNTIGDTSGNKNSLIDLINANTKDITGIKENIGHYESQFSIADRLDNLEDSSGGGIDSGLTARVDANTENIESIKNIIGINDNTVLSETIINTLKRLEDEINKNKLIINQPI